MFNVEYLHMDYGYICELMLNFKHVFCVKRVFTEIRYDFSIVENIDGW